jgi:hypothetical protein
MWDTVREITPHLSHDLPCQRCGHAPHRYLPCDGHRAGVACRCEAMPPPGEHWPMVA